MQSAKEAVEKVVREYIRGTYEGDAELLKQVFHEQAQMAGYLAGDRMYGTAQPFVESIANNPSVKSTGADYQADITHIEVSGDTACATLKEKGLMGLAFTNYFHLMCEDGRWYIISKTFSGTP